MGKVPNACGPPTREKRKKDEPSTCVWGNTCRKMKFFTCILILFQLPQLRLRRRAEEKPCASARTLIAQPAVGILASDRAEIHAREPSRHDWTAVCVGEDPITKPYQRSFPLWRNRALRNNGKKGSHVSWRPAATRPAFARVFVSPSCVGSASAEASALGDNRSARRGARET